MSLSNQKLSVFPSFDYRFISHCTVRVSRHVQRDFSCRGNVRKVEAETSRGSARHHSSSARFLLLRDRYVQLDNIPKLVNKVPNTRNQFVCRVDGVDHFHSELMHSVRGKIVPFSSQCGSDSFHLLYQGACDEKSG